MTIMKTEKERLSSKDILNYISDYELLQVPHLNDLWEYYKGKNVKIKNRKTPDPNNPDNRLTVSYGRKLVNTYTGYGYRPKYITYNPNIKSKDFNEDVNIYDGNVKPQPESVEEKKYLKDILTVFNANNEHIKTNRAGRNTAIFGFAYELAYIDKEFKPMDMVLPLKAIPKFFTVDPREMIVLYDYSPEPKKKIAIRFFKLDSTDNATYAFTNDSKFVDEIKAGSDKAETDRYLVEVYYRDRVELYYRERKDAHSKEWTLRSAGEALPNFFGEVPVVAFYMGDEMQSIMENVLPLIDAYDILFSDSMNEFDRFAFAYLVMKKFGITNPIDKKDPNKANTALQLLKRRRVFENLDKDADIKFLTKDIPTTFIQYMAKEIREQIHIQSHIPDFTSEKMNGASGIAIQRLMFDFENLVASAEADFDVGLYDRIKLVTNVLTKLGVTNGYPEMITISHKRNVPLNTIEFAQTAMIMSNAGFSRRAIVGIMPEDIIPNIEKELEYEEIENATLTGINQPVPLPEMEAEETEEEVEETNSEEEAV